MWNQDSHLGDEQILLHLEGELPAGEAKVVVAHLDACWKCRARRQELESAIESFVRVRQRDLDAQLPPADGPRALLRAHLAQLTVEPAGQPNWFARSRGLAVACAAALCLLAAGISLVRRNAVSRPQPLIVSMPNSSLTPGATVLVSRRTVCSESNTKNKAVPASLRQQVFEEYGIKGAEPRAYEVDYLVTPALGGADDIHNLWPHSYSATVWNAQVKDALEDRLRDMVCDGQLDLTEAQQEIASNWIAAYKKYFHTDHPLMEQR